MPAISSTKYLTRIGWKDIPHLSAKIQADMEAGTPRYLRAARRDGIPSLGVGRIYPFDIDDISCQPFRMPDIWPRFFCLDPSWNRTAVLWGCWDQQMDVVYFYGEYYVKHLPPRAHALSIKSRGDWIPGCCDPAARGSSQDEGRKLLEAYRIAGLKMSLADNSLAGIDICEDRMSTGRLKVFEHLQNFRYEFSIYRRDKNGKIVKENDHLMDCMKYAILTGIHMAKMKPNPFLGMRTSPLPGTLAGF